MPKDFDIDEKIDVEIYRKSKVILNSINFNSVTKSELHRAIDKLAQLDSAEFSAELKQVDFYDYVVVNDNIEECVEKVNSIIISNKCRVDRIEELFVENQEEFMHELLIDKVFENEIVSYE